MSEKRVGVDVDLGIEAYEVPVSADDQRVDLKKGEILLLEHFSKLQENGGELLDLIRIEPELEAELTALEGLRSCEGLDYFLEDKLGSLPRNLLDLGAALSGGHEHNALP